METKPEQNQPAEKPQPKKLTAMEILREKRRDAMIRRHANLGNTSYRKK
jgi:hypothetical protein